jgi:hypothetical protein
VRILFAAVVGGRCHLEPLLDEIDLDVVPSLLGDGVCSCSTTWAKRPARESASRRGARATQLSFRVVRQSARPLRLRSVSRERPLVQRSPLVTAAWQLLDQVEIAVGQPGCQRLDVEYMREPTALSIDLVPDRLNPARQPEPTNELVNLRD